MNYKEKFEQEVRDEVLSWSSDKMELKNESNKR